MKAGKNEPRLCAIVGSQRSGTALMRLILDSHPQVCGLGEERAYAAIEQGYQPEPPAEWLAVPIPIWTELIVDYVAVADLIRDAKLLFMLRDVRDVVASMLRWRDWIEGEVLAKFDLWMTDSGRRFARTFGEEAQRWRGDRIASAALFWKYKTSTFFELQRLDWPVLGVSYERLVSDPQPSLCRMLRFLGLPWHDDLLRHHELFHSEVDATGLAMGDTQADRAIDTDSVGRWKQVLSPAESQLILDVAGDLNERIRDLREQEDSA